MINLEPSSPTKPINDQSQDDHVTISNFSISVEQLAEIVENNFSKCFTCQTSGIQQLFHALETNASSGILGDANDLFRRREAFGSNTNSSSEGRSPSSPNKSFFQLTLEAFKDTTVILLLCCAALSLVIGIKRDGVQEGLSDAVYIFLAIIIVVNFGVTYRFFKAKLMKKKTLRQRKVIRVLRHHHVLQIPASEVVVGDIVLLESGNEVPADGIFIHGNNSFKLDDSLAHEHFINHSQHPSLFTGTKILEGNVQYLVTAVGKNTERSKLMKLMTSFRNDHEGDHESKLQNSIEKMSSLTEKLWLILSLLILVMQVFRCFLWKKSWCCDKDHNPDPKGVKNTVAEIMIEATKYMRKRGGTKVNGMVAMLCILIFSLRDGLSLGIFIILLFASKEMKMSHQAIVHKLPSCATGALVTTLCLGKTFDFVLKHSMMADLWIGFEEIINVPAGSADHEELRSTLIEGICMNISGVDHEDALLIWAEKVLGGDINELHQNCTMLSRETFYPGKRLCGLLLKRNEEAGDFMHVHWKGEPKLVLSMCSHYYDINGTMQTLHEDKRQLFNRKIDSIISDGLNCFGFAYKTAKLEEEKEGDEPIELAKNGLSFLGVVVIKNQYSPELRQTIEGTRESGIEIKLLVDDNLNTARIMALNSGILRIEDDLEGAIVEAAEFRSSSKEAQISMCQKIKVMANSSPADKLLMMHCLRRSGEVVAATGTSIRDLPFLKEADVGVFMGESCAELAKEYADITVADAKLCMIIPTILLLGRYVCTNIEKFIQLQLILNISAFTSSFVLLIFNPTSEEQLTAFQMLWVNLIMEVLGSLFLSLITSAVKPEILETHQVMNISRPIYGTGAPIITKNMLRNIAIQSLFQVALLLMLSMKGKEFFRVDEALLRTMIFNSYVLCQVFLLIISAIEITSTFKENTGRSPRRKYLLMASAVIVGIIVALHVILIQIMSKVAHWRQLGMKQWFISIGTAALSLPLHFAAKMTFDAMQSLICIIA